MKLLIWRKSFVKIQIMIISIMICVGILSGCNEKSASLTDEERRFVGTWNGNISVFDVIAFFPDRACSHYSDLSGNWEIKDGKLVITVKDAEYTYDYSFSNNDDVLTIKEIASEISRVYRRQ
jgi:hypothetical protein